MATQSRRAKCLMSRCRVRRVGRLAFAMAMAAALSSYIGIAEVCGMSRSVSIDRKYKDSFPASAAAMNSASVELCETVGWKRER